MMEEFKIEIVPSNKGYKANIYTNDNIALLSIRIGLKPHLWHVDILLGAYKLYWESVGLRRLSLNKQEGIEWFSNEHVTKSKLSKTLVNFICRMDDPEQPNTLFKLSKSRYVYLESSPDKTKEIFAGGGIEEPYFFIRAKNSTNIIARFDCIEDARLASI